MNVSATFTKVLAFWVAFAPMRSLAADPCGMVPPIDVTTVGAIQRTGVQQTYVFYKDGIESLVIQPAFVGDVEEFGMLVPFPSPPSVRKERDDVFEQIAAAIDPPEVVVDLRPRGPATGTPGAAGPSGPSTAGPGPLRYDEVRVLSREAVGMYEVAVLAAGSAKALARWMTQHRFRYPTGMDAVCDDYVAEGWCFVAVKTLVGSNHRAAPRPGQRRVDPRRPRGSRFGGSVQAMGFRFRSDELVVPMRLSTFNGGDPRNVVYLLTDEPQAIRSLPRDFVKRQVRGRRLMRNLTEPLPLRVLGGTLGQISEARRAKIVRDRDPAPHNGGALQLFNRDLEAVRLGALANDREAANKRLATINHRLGLQGEAIEALVESELAADFPERSAPDRDLRSMTLTVIDGPFSREVLARENLTFVGYRMPSSRNRSERYDAKVMGPSRRNGTLVAWPHTAGPRPPLGPVTLLLFATFVVVLERRRLRVRLAAERPLPIGDR